MTDHATLSKFLAPGAPWLPCEKKVIMWQFRLNGDFQSALWEAITRADEGNLKRLAYGFPEEVEGFNMWRRGDLANRLRMAGLDL